MLYTTAAAAAVSDLTPGPRPSWIVRASNVTVHYLVAQTVCNAHLELRHPTICGICSAQLATLPVAAAWAQLPLQLLLLQAPCRGCMVHHEPTVHRSTEAGLPAAAADKPLPCMPCLPGAATALTARCRSMLTSVSAVLLQSTRR